MTIGRMISAGIAAMLLGLAGSALAQDAPQNVLVYDYAINHPTEDAQMPTQPSIGASVPANVMLATTEGDDTVYGYFYFHGRPVIVDLDTRSIVRIGD